jgi:hypothetical protein
MTGRAPEVSAYRHPNNVHWIIWCDQCRWYHLHGISSNGHRVAHCVSKKSVYDETGYFLVGRGDAPREMLRDLQRKRPHGPAGTQCPENENA